MLQGVYKSDRLHIAVEKAVHFPVYWVTAVVGRALGANVHGHITCRVQICNSGLCETAIVR